MSIEPTFKDFRRSGSGTLYFPGCVGLSRKTDIVRATSHLLDAIGIDHDIHDGLCCCGSPLKKIGALEEADALRQRNMAVFKGYDRIITSCPGCTYHLRKEYGVTAEHIVDVLASSDRVPAPSRNVRCAVQVPCHLKRGMGALSEGRLFSILERAGVEVVRMEGEDACCGGGGGVLAGFPELASAMAAGKWGIYAEKGIKTVLTACPFCNLNLGRNGDIQVLDICEMLTMDR